MKKKQTISQAKQTAWKYFSLYFRRVEADDKGELQCYTCGVKKYYKEMQTGHWVTGHSNVTYINLDYVRPQCYQCNVPNHGEQGIFRDKIRQELGDEVVDELLLLAKQPVKMTLSDYQELARFYKESLQSLS